MQRGYARTLGWALAHPRLIVLVLLATIGLNIYLYIIVPKGFFPQQDTGRIVGGIQADQSTSFQAMKGKFSEMMRHRAGRSGRGQRRRASPAGGRPIRASCSSR